ncbi:MAG: response regulator [Desulfamplus sp.]|nr:response regulator [Desulfamplus sp.]
MDDSWLTRRGVKRILSAQGYGVSEAENGLQAMEMLLAKDSSVDVIILDLLMPEMSGIEFLEKIKDYSIRLPVIVLTADIQHTMKEKCIMLGASGFMNKPPDPEKLVELVNEVCDRLIDNQRQDN